MNARTLVMTIAACGFLSAPGEVMCATPVERVPWHNSGLVIENGQVASLVGTGLPFQLRSPAATILPEPGLGPSAYSDARLKTDIRAMANALITIQKLRGVTFRWDPAQFKDRTVPAGRQIGFIAQEAQRVLPEVVTTDERGYLSIEYINVIPLLVEAIKEQQKKIDANDAAIEKLRSDADDAVRDLQTRLADVEDALTRLTAANTATANQGQYQQIAPGVWRQY